MIAALYNEIDPFAATWLRNLSAAGHIAPGVVDERSISDLAPADVAGPGQRHFFAGIGGWSHALRLAGVPDDADVWTGSCPCQPFSAAGRGLGTADARHLWPVWFRLISECRPAVIFGEQVASGPGLGWLDAVYADLEGAGYAVGAADLCAAGVGSNHARSRLFFVAHAMRPRLARPEPDRQELRGAAITPSAVSGNHCLGARVRIHPDSVPAEPTDGFPRPVGFVRAVGNAIVPQVAAAFIRAALEAA